MIKLNCLECKKIYLVFPSVASHLGRRKSKFCSLNCHHSNMKKRIDEKSPLWKGDKVSYRNLHRWVERKLGKPSTCECCKKSNLHSYYIHWANKSGNYLRDLSDWIRLCVSCHWLKDKNQFKRNKEILKMRERGKSLKELAKLFDLHYKYISQIIINLNGHRKSI